MTDCFKNVEMFQNETVGVLAKELVFEVSLILLCDCVQYGCGGMHPIAPTVYYFLKSSTLLVIKKIIYNKMAANGDKYMAEGEKALNKSSIFGFLGGGNSKYENAAEEFGLIT